MALAAIQMRMLIVRNRKGLSICPRANKALNGHNTNTWNKSRALAPVQVRAILPTRLWGSPTIPASGQRQNRPRSQRVQELSMSRLWRRSARRADEIRLVDFPRQSNHLSVYDTPATTGTTR